MNPTKEICKVDVNTAECVRESDSKLENEKWKIYVE